MNGGVEMRFVRLKFELATTRTYYDASTYEQQSDMYK